MDKVTTKSRFIAIPFFLLLLFTSDSIIYSQQQVLSFFKTSKSYPYLAANYGDSQASFELYQTSNDLYWLEKSAKQMHPKSAFLWSFNTANMNDANEWLRQSIRLAHSPAALYLLERLVSEKRWQQADAFVKQHQLLLIQIPEQEARIKQINELIALALSNGPLFEQQQKRFHDWLNKQSPDFEHLVNHLTDTSLALKSAQGEMTLVQTAQSQTVQTETTQHKTAAQSQCKMVIQPLLEQKGFNTHISKFKHALYDSDLDGLPICFNEPLFVPQLASLCDSDSASRANCEIDGLIMLAEVYTRLADFSHLLIVTNKGEANVRGGIMFVDQNDNAQVFMHELTHWLGLVDEYPLSSPQQKQLCNASGVRKLGHNVYVAPKSWNKQALEDELGFPLYETNTCEDKLGAQAYKVSAETSVMEFLDTPLSESYAKLIKTHIRWQDVPVAALNFEHVFNSDIKIGTQSIQSLASLTSLYYAALWGNASAIYQLSQSINDDDALSSKLLTYAAELGSEQAQLELGHDYLEGVNVQRDYKKSAFWFGQAASSNSAFGLYFYGKCFELGWGCKQSLEQATTHYKKSAMLGNELAIKRLRHLTSSP